MNLKKRRQKLPQKIQSNKKVINIFLMGYRRQTSLQIKIIIIILYIIIRLQ